MKKLLGIALLFGSASFGQTSNPMGGLPQAYLEGMRLKMEMQRAQAQQNVMNAEAAAIRAKTEELRLQAERAKQTAKQDTPADALIKDADFSRLPIAIRVKFVKLVAPELGQYSDADLASVLESIASKMLGSVTPPAK